jgi:elongation factor P
MSIIDGVDIRVGNILDYEKRLWKVLKTMHTQPGKGGAYMQVEMKDIHGETKKNVRFRSDEKIAKAQLEEHPAQFLYSEGDLLTFMEEESYEQVTVNKNLLDSTQLKFLSDGLKVILEFYNGEVVLIKLPETVIVRIAECEAAIKNQTAASSYKPAILENGVRISVPPFMESGEKILINLEELKYLERVK